jgi:hypothetical protein
VVEIDELWVGRQASKSRNSADAGAASGDLPTTIISGSRAAAIVLVSTGPTMIDAAGSTNVDLLR